MITDSQAEEKLSRRERERLSRRQAMLEAARAVFAEKGYTHATLEEIAQRAEFGKGTLYNYFEGGKEEILFAIFDELYDEMGALITASFLPDKVAGRPMRLVFRDFVEDALTFFMERQDLFMILVKEAQRMTFSEDRDKMAYFMEQRDRLVNALVGPLEEAMRRGDLRSLPPHAVAHMILGNINGLQMHMTLEECSGHIEDDPVLGSARKAADFLTTMLFDGLRATPSGSTSVHDSPSQSYATSHPS